VGIVGRYVGRQSLTNVVGYEADTTAPEVEPQALYTLRAEEARDHAVFVGSQLGEWGACHVGEVSDLSSTFG
jgi:hypothetical protein